MRRKTRQIRIGNVLVGGDAPVVVQSMTTTYTRDVKSTVEQIHRLQDVGCEIVRVAVPEMEDAVVLGEIKKQIRIPLVADIHYNPELAMEAIRQGVDKVRINPGNLLEGRTSFERIVRAAKERDIAMRIGVNSGSIDALDKQAQMQRIQVRLRADGTLEKTDPAEARRIERERLAERMVNKALEYIGWCEELDYHNVIVSLKSSTVLTAVEAYRRFAERSDYPLHLGITEAGTLVTGAVKSAVGMTMLLADGIGDTLRVSLSAEPEEEIPVAYEILKALELRNRGVTFVSCPSCGRVEIDVIGVANEVEKRLSKVSTPIHVAVMGCVVNGPGESRDADVGLAGGKGKGVIFRKGKVVRTVPEDQFLDAVLKEVASLLPEHEARLVYPEGGIQDITYTHRTRDEGMNLPLAARN
ncbi:4-hydroxy-3-methylbut-2-en-1-yl diphosphate synthase [Thermosporothrix hazakensis]|jgi:(E)-4-hydroxy-3-methylbut-2-enyl-diphosphate synthase|uniref:4-hydroxy-3-methylbut-2-en-1-yl diphosphate synthase (flavodoxin) n=1 Tax=Thermosporothrix hazakensis TaxID=644383 RepID=A0A326UE24_THEHA|nr:flavodoxin-dependent (E)-4-hydroxy-3-methylbut-2-enyl-diphosphate synthase [Thermosporothrix hazakensis]PZW36175.1 4-hydroxy-3-methylbut-2-en-1-yl diphosphate synthase [Thermosporothrix hazakensis]GCE46826.1 4-hydroxy-3-methylbut-2-en-1-yl diphosphate synthase (flavodoxin) [Thermosporothrix hazakensis]